MNNQESLSSADEYAVLMGYFNKDPSAHDKKVSEEDSNGEEKVFDDKKHFD